MVRLISLVVMSMFLFACATPSPRIQSELLDGKRQFDQGYYKRAMRTLLPLACDGNQDAQYAVGYMYYYGLGVAQDTDVGHFWIQRSANKKNQAAIDALHMINVPAKK